LVWADGVCINQLDIQERNDQVHRIHSIYSKATRTIVYLGGAVGNTCHSAWNYLERESSNALLSARRQHDDHFRGGLEDIEIDVLKRPWFRRLWVLQEVVTSRNVFVQCGRRRTTWDDFCKVVLLEPRLNDRYGFSLRNKDLFEYVTEMFLARTAFLITHGLSNLLPPWYAAIDDHKLRSDYIVDMLARARRLQATDPRDKIYGLLGISSGVDVSDQGIAIDYSKPIATVYRDFAQYIITSAQSYDLLSHASYSRRVPSWVPDWTVPLGPTRTILSTLTPEDEQRRRARASLVKRHHDWPPSSTLSTRTLRSLGRMVGTVSQVTPPIVLQGQHETRFEALRERYKAQPGLMRESILRTWEEFPWQNETFNSYESVSKGTAFIAPTTLLSPPAYPLMANTFAQPSKRETKTWRSYPDRLSRLSRLTAVDGPAARSQGNDENRIESDSNTIEEHLMRRSRQSVLWTDDRSLAVETVVDKSSIVDHRAFAHYAATTWDLSNRQPRKEKGIALVHSAAQPGDLIVMLTGARVPFVVRVEESSYGRLPIAPRSDSERVALLTQPPAAVKCMLIGECLFNGFERFDSAVYPHTPTMPGDRMSFIFDAPFQGTGEPEGPSEERGYMRFANLSK